MPPDVSVVLFDGKDDDGRMSRADKRLQRMQDGKPERISHILNDSGSPAKTPSAFIVSAAAEIKRKLPLLIFAHTGAVKPEALATEAPSWDPEGCRLTCLVIYSGGGVDATLAKPIIEDPVGSLFARATYIRPSIDIIGSDITALIDFFRLKAFCLQPGRPDRNRFLDEFDRLINRANNCSQSWLTALHIAFSVYLAAKALNPRTGRRVFYDLDQSASNSLANDFQKIETWGPFLAVPHDELGKALHEEGVKASTAWATFERFLAKKQGLPSDQQMVEIWKSLDEKLSRP